jgi:hypothetical protein
MSHQLAPREAEGKEMDAGRQEEVEAGAEEVRLTEEVDGGGKETLGEHNERETTLIGAAVV